MKKKVLIILFLLLITLILSSCNLFQDADEEEVTIKEIEEEEVVTEEEKFDDQVINQLVKDDILTDQTLDQLERDSIDDYEMDLFDSRDRIIHYSPFSGLAIDHMSMQRAVMVIVENALGARPQSGLHDAAIIYEILAEGGITRFMALYWDRIPEKIGPVRSARPYKVEIAKEYDALLLNAGGSTQALEMLAGDEVDNLDQIYGGSRYFWRSNDRESPHNLYTGRDRIVNYLNNMLGREYQERFNFQRVSFITEEDRTAEYIKVNYWGGTTVVFKYDSNTNSYLRYYGQQEIPHMSDNRQIEASNLIIQYVKTRQIDDLGRLEMDLDDRGRAILFNNGIVVDGFWEKEENKWTMFYDNNGQEMLINPGQTWIMIVPSTIQVDYHLEDIDEPEETEVIIKEHEEDNINND